MANNCTKFSKTHTVTMARLASKGVLVYPGSKRLPQLLPSLAASPPFPLPKLGPTVSLSTTYYLLILEQPLLTDVFLNSINLFFF